MEKRITLATIKSFIKNSNNLHIKCKSRFDGMTDGIEQIKNSGFDLAQKSDRFANTLGIDGAWFVFGSRDYFSKFENENFRGYEVSNCCGSFILANPKN